MVQRPKTNLTVRVKVDRDENGVQQSVQTEMVCEHCGKDVDVRFNSLNTVHNVLCPEHGLLTTFSNRDALMKFSKDLTNMILAAHGHDAITDKTNVAHIDDKPDPNSIN
jgi:hypothetical protein